MPPAMADHALQDRQLWIDGRPAPARSGRFEPVKNPATGETLARVARGGPEEINAAVAAAKRSYEKGEWRRATAMERAKVLLRLAELAAEAGVPPGVLNVVPGPGGIKSVFISQD